MHRSSFRAGATAVGFTSCFAFAAGLSHAAPRAAEFDGSWSVTVVAENGACTDRYTIPLQVSGGQVRYEGKFRAKAEGRISPNGRLNVSFSHESDVVSAKGTLDGSKGLGSWSSPTKRCDGTWTARRR